MLASVRLSCLNWPKRQRHGEDHCKARVNKQAKSDSQVKVVPVMSNSHRPTRHNSAGGVNWLLHVRCVFYGCVETRSSVQQIILSTRLPEIIWERAASPLPADRPITDSRRTESSNRICQVAPIWVKIGRAVLELYEWTDRQTSRHTHHNTSHPFRGRSIYANYPGRLCKFVPVFATFSFFMAAFTLSYFTRAYGSTHSLTHRCDCFCSVLFGGDAAAEDAADE